MNLYELSKDYKELKNLEDMQNDEVDQLLSLLNGKIEEKAKNISIILKEMDYSIETIDKELKRLQDRKKVKQNAYKRLKDYLLMSMIDLDKKKIDTGINTITVRNNAESVKILDTQEIEAKYFKVKKVESLDKKSIIKEYKESGICPCGVQVVKSKSLMVK